MDGCVAQGKSVCVRVVSGAYVPIHSTFSLSPLIPVPSSAAAMTTAMTTMIRELRNNVEEVMEKQTEHEDKVKELESLIEQAMATMELGLEALAEKVEEKIDRIQQDMRKDTFAGGGMTRRREIFDRKDLPKPDVFKGQASDFYEWNWSVLDLLTFNVTGVEKLLDWAKARGNEPITLDAAKNKMVELGVEEQEDMINQIYVILNSYTRGEPRGVVRSALRNGVEAWRKLHYRYDPPTTNNQTATLTKLNNPSRCKRLGEVGAAIESWEELERRYTQQTKEVLPDTMRRAALMKLVPEDLEKHLELVSSRVGAQYDYDDMRREVMNFVEATVVTHGGINLLEQNDDHETDDKYDSKDSQQLGALGSEKGNKGASKGFKGKCWLCEGPHRAFECPKFPAKAAAKGKGKTGGKPSGNWWPQKGKGKGYDAGKGGKGLQAVDAAWSWQEWQEPTSSGPPALGGISRLCSLNLKNSFAVLQQDDVDSCDTSEQDSHDAHFTNQSEDFHPVVKYDCKTEESECKPKSKFQPVTKYADDNKESETDPKMNFHRVNGDICMTGKNINTGDNDMSSVVNRKMDMISGILGDDSGCWYVKGKDDFPELGCSCPTSKPKSLGARLPKGSFRKLELNVVSRASGNGNKKAPDPLAAAAAVVAAEQQAQDSQQDLMRVSEVKHSGQWIEIDIDSGAAESVAPTSWFPDYPNDKTSGLFGTEYATASGEPLFNEGQVKLNLVTSDRQMRTMQFQKTKVTRPLGSVKRIAGAGHTVVFDDEGSFLYNKQSGDVTWLRERDGGYVLDALVTPFVGNCNVNALNTGCWHGDGHLHQHHSCGSGSSSSSQQQQQQPFGRHCGNP